MQSLALKQDIMHLIKPLMVVFKRVDYLFLQHVLVLEKQVLL